ncbi:hypothetical protein CVT25_004891 [Psilocybe cyanescens]|uniref:Protein kinase domain-containing protein n=1 Tax=Psilocybe cyanescens TaxID=93625 RepID=A0A409XBL0_PSICY|nr:hypothetical protein CVT25_004891 [Psilocybe cyanescens]
MSSYSNSECSTSSTATARDELPTSLDKWRALRGAPYVTVWDELRALLEQHGFRLWKIGIGRQLWEDGNDFPQCDNFLFLTPHKHENISLVRWKRFTTAMVGLRHAARMNGVRDVVLRVITCSGEGHTHLRVLKRLSSPPDILLSNNHILPILYEIAFEDIVILAVPKLIFCVFDVVNPDRHNSVEDMLYMVLQIFEAAAYLHQNFIGHQDLFLSNFMVEWMPQSMIERTSTTRPRVYVIDFETAVEFSEDSLESERLCPTFPVPLDVYRRPVAPELQTMQPYCPFRLDMWQLGADLHANLKVGADEIDQLWLELGAPIPQDRPTADDALKVLDAYLRRTPSLELHRKIPIPSYYPDDWEYN